MLTNEQINTIHRLRFVEKWTVRQIARHLHIGRRTIAKYLVGPAQSRPHPQRASKLDPFKPPIQQWLDQDSSISAAVIFQRLRELGFTGGATRLCKIICKTCGASRRRDAPSSAWSLPPANDLRSTGRISAHSSTTAHHANSMPSLW